MGKEAKTNAMRMLDRKKVKYEVIAYDCGEFIVPIEKEVDRKAAAKSVGEKTVDMIHVKDLTKITGYIRGGCSPLGMKKNYPVVFDQSAENFGEIYVSGGRVGLTLKVPLKDLLDVTQGKLAPITME